MRAYLHTHVRLEGQVLHDTYLGVRYCLSPDAAWLMAQLKYEPDIEQLVRLTAGRKLVSTTAARNAIYQLLADIGAFGAVRMRWRHPYPLLLRLYATARWRVRCPGSPWGFCGAMTRAYGGLVVAAGLLTGVIWLYSGGLFPLWWACIPAAVFLSCAVHEAGHGLAARGRGVRFVWLAHAGYAAMMYTRPSGGNTGRVIALAGPLAAGVVYSLAAYAVLPFSVVLFWLSVATALIHLIHILPVFADGKSLWRNT